MDKRLASPYVTHGSSAVNVSFFEFFSKLCSFIKAWNLGVVVYSNKKNA